MKPVSDLLALVTILIWPAIPLFWIPVHGLPALFRRLGRLSYLVPAVLWSPLAYAIIENRSRLISFSIPLSSSVMAFGAALLLLGTALHVWTGKLLSLRGLVGLPEISEEVDGRLTAEGPFAVVRHPTYLAHTIMLAGVFLMTGVIATAFVTILDLLLVNAIIIPLEERELSQRFGADYDEYRRRVPRLFPNLKRRSDIHR